MRQPFHTSAVLVLCLLLSSVAIGRETSPVSPGERAIGGLRVIAVATLADGDASDAPTLLPEDDLVVDATLAGGLSAIDYDAETGEWAAISDDPSENAPARYYTLDLAYDADGIDTFNLASAVTLLQANGEPYPSATEGGNVPDLEAIRFDPTSDTLWYASEGSHDLGVDPFVAGANLDGRLVTSWVPPMFTVATGKDRGPRENLAFEGLAFAADGDSLWVAMEGPLYQDGAPSTFDTASLPRFTETDRDGNVLRQVAYQIEPLPEWDGPVMATTAGVSEILAIADDRLLVLERASIESDAGTSYFVSVYEVNVAAASDVSGVESLQDASFVPVSKRLVLDLNAAGVEPLGNVEGMAWGPDLENGNQSIVLIADDNFDEAQETAVIVLEVLP